MFAGLTFAIANLTIAFTKLTFVFAGLTFVSAGLTFVFADLTIAFTKLTFVFTKLTFAIADLRNVFTDLENGYSDQAIAIAPSYKVLNFDDDSLDFLVGNDRASALKSADNGIIPMNRICLRQSNFAGVSLSV